MGPNSLSQEKQGRHEELFCTCRVEKSGRAAPHDAPPSTHALCGSTADRPAQPDAVREKVKEVSVDMWSGFTAVIKELFPNAKIIYDRFHVMAIINDELNNLRKLMGVHEKGLPHLLWKNKEDLKDEQKQQLEVILKEHPCLGIADEMKEEIRQIYQGCRTFKGAERKLEKWIRIGGIL